MATTGLATRDRFVPVIHHRPKPVTCPLCGERDATLDDEIDGRAIRVCARCKTWKPPVLANPATAGRDRILRVIARFDGAPDLADIADAMGEDTIEGRKRIQQVLYRAIAAGLVRVTGRWNRTYRLSE